MHFLWNGDLYLLQVEVQACLHTGTPSSSQAMRWDAVVLQMRCELGRCRSPDEM